jgi:hypothetical protein
MIAGSWGTRDGSRKSRRHRLDAVGAGEAGGECEDREQVRAFEVGIVGEHFVERHSRAEEVKERFDRVAETADAGLAVAYGRVDGDAVEWGHREIIAGGDSREGGGT